MVLLMDIYKSEPLRSVAQRKASAAPTEEVYRPPLVPSEKNNAAPGVRKPRTGEITSRYKSGVTPAAPAASRRSPSPVASRTAAASGHSQPKRAQSAERRRSATPLSRSSAPPSPSSRPSTPSSPRSRSSTPVRESAIDVHLSSRRLVVPRTTDGLWPSMRSLSSSFQSESISIPTSKKDKPVSGNKTTPDPVLKASVNALPERKRTPLRGRNISNQSENSKPVENSHSRVVDQHRWPGVVGAKLSASSFTRSMDLTPLPISSRGVSPRRRIPLSDGPGKLLQKSTTDGTRRMSLDGIGRADYVTGSPLSVSLNRPERPSSVTRPGGTPSLPISTANRPSSPSKVSMPAGSSVRGMASPSRTRPSTPFSSSSAVGRTGTSSSVLSYIVDARKVKKSANHVEDAHHLRLLYNRYMQWRFVNARAETALAVQKMTTEDVLYNVWVTTSELHNSVAVKKINIERLRLEMKFGKILKEQMAYLEHWASVEREYSSSLTGAIEALQASTIRLPVTGGAMADFFAVKDAISSAVDVMQIMGSSVCCLLSRVDDANSLVSELADVAAKEREMLDECRELLASTASLQVQESSLRTHFLQLHQDMPDVGYRSQKL